MFLFVFYWSLLKIIKFWAHEITKRKNLWPAKYRREKILDPRNTHVKKSWTHEIPRRKNLRPTKYPWENILNPRSTHKKTFRTHEGTMAWDQRNLAKSFKSGLLYTSQPAFICLNNVNTVTMHKICSKVTIKTT